MGLDPNDGIFKPIPSDDDLAKLRHLSDERKLEKIAEELEELEQEGILILAVGSEVRMNGHTLIVHHIDSDRLVLKPHPNRRVRIRDVRAVRNEYLRAGKEIPKGLK